MVTLTVALLTRTTVRHRPPVRIWSPGRIVAGSIGRHVLAGREVGQCLPVGGQGRADVRELTDKLFPVRSSRRRMLLLQVPGAVAEPAGVTVQRPCDPGFFGGGAVDSAGDPGSGVLPGGVAFGGLGGVGEPFTLGAQFTRPVHCRVHPVAVAPGALLAVVPDQDRLSPGEPLADLVGSVVRRLN